jgi:hypothetical protein
MRAQQVEIYQNGCGKFKVQIEHETTRLCWTWTWGFLPWLKPKAVTEILELPNTFESLEQAEFVARRNLQSYQAA